MADDDGRPSATDLAGILPIPMLTNGASPDQRRPRLVVAQPYATSLSGSFSGSTYYMARSGISAGLLEGAFGLAHGDPRRDLGLNAAGGVWKIGDEGARAQHHRLQVHARAPVADMVAPYARAAGP